MDRKTKTGLCCMRKLESRFLHEKYRKSNNVCPMSAQCLPNVCPMSAQCLPNVCPMSAQCPQFPLNVPYVCLMFLISAQCPICLPNVPNFCPMSFAVKSRISSDMFYIVKPGRRENL